MKFTFALVVASLAVAASLAAPFGESEDVELLLREAYSFEGNFADASDSPYTVGLTLYNKMSKVRRCGAARFNKHWFITAAECLDAKKYDTVGVRVPADENSGLQSSISYIALDNLSFKVHPGYNAKTKENNIAVFRGQKTHTNPKKFLSLPHKSDQKKSFFPEPVVISSWARVNTPGKFNKNWHMNVLPTKVEIPSVCKKQYPTEVVEEYHMCVTNPGGKVLTENEAGTPLVLETSGEPVLVGIASHITTPLDSTNAPMVFLKTTPYLEWIHKETSVELLD